MKVIVAVCFIKMNSHGEIDTELQADVIEANNQDEALGIMMRRKPADRQIGAFLSRELKEPKA